mmetsp:Transcript_28515/g.33714  ORF Transcript_28515/g.33714 Transcript_28515/m.33714 type:complete len:680 (+) Transcript_28515:24-2063(+)
MGSSLMTMKVKFDLPSTPDVSNGSDNKAEEAQKAPLGHTPSQGLQHFTYECSNFTGKGSRMAIEPNSFHQLFKTMPSICIPLFQRTYCWNDKQILGWWSDAQGLGSRGSKVLGGSHGTGKCVFKRYVEEKGGKPFLLCIDGQQRCTTYQLMLASLRDSILKELRRGLSLGHSNVDQDIVRRTLLAVTKIDRLLFGSVSGANEWVQAFARNSKLDQLTESYDDNHLQDHFECIWANEVPDGKVIIGAEPKLTPSFADRAPFLACVFGGLCSQEVWRCSSSSTSSLTTTKSSSVRDPLLANVKDFKTRVSLSVEGAYHKVWGHSRQVSAKKHFDQGIELMLRSRQGDMHTHGDDNTQDTLHSHEIRLEILSREAKRLIKRFSFIMVEVLSEINLPQVFLWLQEKSLFGMGALLFNPTPGVKFHASDLVRNLVLSSITCAATGSQKVHALVRDETETDGPEACQDNKGTSIDINDQEVEVLRANPSVLSLAHQEDRYRKVWLEPLECLVGGIENLDACISDFLADSETRINVYLNIPSVGKFEKTLKIIEDSNIGQYVCPLGKKRTTGIDLYAHFVTAAEVVEMELRHGTPNVTTTTAAAAAISPSSDTVKDDANDDDKDDLASIMAMETIEISEKACSIILADLSAYAQCWVLRNSSSSSVQSISDRDRDEETDDSHSLVY